MPPLGAAFFWVIAMRYLYLLIFIFLSFFSSVLLATESPNPSCESIRKRAFCATADCGSWANWCLDDPASHFFYEESFDHGNTFNCSSSCVCPDGWKLNVVINGGVKSSSCVPDEPTPELCENGLPAPAGQSCNDQCPSGMPKVNGECPVCPMGFNPDGTCIGSSCGPGQITQGYINGQAICQGACSDPNQSWGSVNGVEGCYGSCTCSNGGSYGTVNGVPGCYGGNGPGSCGSGSNTSGSNTSSGSGSNTSSGTGNGSGSGSNTSSGGGSGSGDSGSGDNGGGSGGGSGGNSNSIGADYPQQVSCPNGFVKENNKCVSPDRGDCPLNYHELVVSVDPFVFWCVPDNPPQSSSASSTPHSSPSSTPQSSQSNSQQNSSSASQNSGTGSGSSTGSGSGSGSGGGSGSGACDPTAENYLECIGSGEDFTEGQRGGFDDQVVNQEIQQLEQQIKQKITDIKTQIAEQFGGSIVGQGTITDYCKNVRDVSVCFGFAKFSAYLPAISQAIFLLACVFSFYIVVKR